MNSMGVNQIENGLTDSYMKKISQSAGSQLLLFSNRYIPPEKNTVAAKSSGTFEKRFLMLYIYVKFNFDAIVSILIDQAFISYEVNKCLSFDS